LEVGTTVSLAPVVTQEQIAARAVWVLFVLVLS